MIPKVDGSREAVREFVWKTQRVGKTVGVVMTMGALHDGHLSLVEACNAECDATIVTIFVNPTQFGPTEDLEKYPRQLEADVESLSALSVDMIFTPAVEQMYGPNHSTNVQPPAVSGPLEGVCRPGHFAGVATIVLKLLNVIPANVAFFGSKDYQQLQVIRAMVRDLDVCTKIVGCPIVRDSDGLAMSSRNAYMTGDERNQALSLSKGLNAAVATFGQGERDASTLAEKIRQQLVEAGIKKIDYVTVANPETLEPAVNADENSIALIAAYVGKTRLIDNRRLGDGPIVSS